MMKESDDIDFCSERLDVRFHPNFTLKNTFYTNRRLKQHGIEVEITLKDTEEKHTRSNR
jgi:hypothetical protein